MAAPPVHIHNSPVIFGKQNYTPGVTTKRLRIASGARLVFTLFVHNKAEGASAQIKVKTSYSQDMPTYKVLHFSDNGAGEHVKKVLTDFHQDLEIELEVIGGEVELILGMTCLDNAVTNEAIKFNPNDPLIDMTNRLKTAKATQLVAASWNYDKQPLLFAELTSGGAQVLAPDSATNQASFLRLRTTGAAGEKIQFQTKRYLRYNPYREHELNFSYIFGDHVPNQKTTVGQFTAKNGWYWQHNGSQFLVGLRNNVDQAEETEFTEVPQGEWNVDNLDGAGPSGLSIDLRNGIVFYIRYVWHGVNGIEFGVDYFNQKVPVHRVYWSGNYRKPFSQSALLPIGLEIENLADTVASESLLGPVSFDIHGGEKAEVGYTRSVGMNNTGKQMISTSDFVNLMAIRTKPIVNGWDNKSILSILGYEIFGAVSGEYQVIIGASISGGTWGDIGPDSIAERNIGAFTFTGGRVIDSGYFVALGNKSAGGAFQTTAPQDIFVAMNTLTGQDEAIVIRTRKIEGGQNGTAQCNIRWKEIF